ncbi:MAG TPA: hypothetical protein VJZ91_11230 [Blastocatellia bacterium]|nr:hypothetical protein [Blastocatellia bacterium]
MMFCSYHTQSAARVQCTSCHRGLCPACDHRIKGYAYCQDCIVMGIESLSQRHQRGRSKTKARLAALCALIPGMGAVYNRQNLKAVVHFVGIVGLFNLTKLHVMPGLFALAGVVVYIYSMMDAYRTADRIAQGDSAEADEARFKRKLAKHAPALGVGLIVLGALMVVQVLRPFVFISPARLLPVALIILGGFLLTRYFKRSSGDVPAPDYDRPPYPVVPGSFGDPAHTNVRPMARFGERR